MTPAYKSFTLITGASSGIGAELARLCAGDGRNLILVARRGDTLRKLAEDLGHDITIHLIAQDLAEHGAAEKIYKKVRRLRIQVDQLINNAGFGDYTPLAKANAVRQERMIAVNIAALTMLTTLFLPTMTAQRRGRIMNVSSVLGFVPFPCMSVYAASKSYVLSFSESLSQELRGTGVSVTCLCPGATRTGFSRAARLHGTHNLSRSKVTPAAVARFGYRAMLAGTPVAIYGLKNRLLIAIMIRLLPRAAIRRLMRSYSN